MGVVIQAPPVKPVPLPSYITDFIIWLLLPQLYFAIIYCAPDNDREFIQLNFATEYRFARGRDGGLLPQGMELLQYFVLETHRGRKVFFVRF